MVEEFGGGAVGAGVVNLAWRPVGPLNCHIVTSGGIRLFGCAVFRLFLCFPQLGLRASRGNEDCRIIRSKMKTKLKIVAVALITGVALGSLTGLSSCQRQQESALKPIDKAALQTMVDTTAKEHLIQVLNLSITSRL